MKTDKRMNIDKFISNMLGDMFSLFTRSFHGHLGGLYMINGDG